MSCRSGAGLPWSTSVRFDDASGFTSNVFRRFFPRYRKINPMIVSRRAAARIAPTTAPAFTPVDGPDGALELEVAVLVVAVDVVEVVAGFDVDDTLDEAEVEVLVPVELLVVVMSEVSEKRRMGHAHA